ncbi:hypothetical protein EV426DRAFT_715341 [Tirmania nivea]|nr:hypothetical protein EV426DRAFT_715341 [Tirmania nivea]
MHGSTSPGFKIYYYVGLLFVPVGELRQTLYGATEGVKPENRAAGGDVENPLGGSQPNPATARLKQHIEVYYARGGVRPTAPDDAEKKIWKWRCYVMIAGLLEKTGFGNTIIPLLIFNISNLAYTILNVEFSLRMNNIDETYDMWSVGQLIPVIIGVGGIVIEAVSFISHLRGTPKDKKSAPQGVTEFQKTESTPDKITPQAVHVEAKGP